MFSPRKLHSGMKTYGCELCGKRFLDSLRLRMHLLAHSGGLEGDARGGTGRDGGRMLSVPTQRRCGRMARASLGELPAELPAAFPGQRIAGLFSGAQ